MVRVSVFDHDYYARTHLPLVAERLKPFGLLRYEIDRGIAGSAPPPFVAAGHLYFHAAADFQKGMGAHGKEIMADVPNYTNITPQLQISEIVG